MMIAARRPAEDEPKPLSDMSEAEMLTQYHEFSELARMADSPHFPKAKRSFAEALREIRDAYLKKTGKSIEGEAKNK
jgi:hypothetical protein